MALSASGTTDDTGITITLQDANSWRVICPDTSIAALKWQLSGQTEWMDLAIGDEDPIVISGSRNEGDARRSMVVTVKSASSSSDTTYQIKPLDVS